MTGLALAAVALAAAGAVAAGVALNQTHRCARELQEQEWLFTGHLWAHDPVPL